LPQLVIWLNGTEPTKIFTATVGIRKILRKDDPSYIQRIIDANVIYKLLDFLDSKFPIELRFESLWCLINIATGTEMQVQSLTEKGAVPIFIKLLQDEHTQIRDQAIWALGNIAGENSKYRDLVINCGVFEAILQLFKNATDLPHIKNIIWTLSTLARGRPKVPFESIKIVIPCFCAAICKFDDKELLADCCWALSFIIDGNEREKNETIIKAGIVPRLINLIGHKSKNVVIPTLRVLGSLLAGDEEIAQNVLDCGILEPLSNIISSPKDKIRKEAVFVSSNIAAGTTKQSHLVIESGIAQKIIELAKTDTFEIKKECVWVLSCLSDKMTDLRLMENVLNMGIIEALCGMLNATEARILFVAMEGLESLLEKGIKYFITPVFFYCILLSILGWY